jgi:anti-anti-sigma regulatory factor
MLRITDITDGGPGVLLKLEGKLSGPWVEELSRVCAELDGVECRAIRLDLSAVNFLDEAGTRLLRKLMQGGAAVTASRFVAELLRREDR